MLFEHSTDKDVAAKLGISVRTAKFHMANLLQKFGVKRRVQIPFMILTKQGVTVYDGAIHAVEELSMHSKFHWKRELSSKSKLNFEERLYQRMMERFAHAPASITKDSEEEFKVSEMRQLGAPMGISSLKIQ